MIFSRAVGQKVTSLIILLTFIRFFPLRAQEGTAIPDEPLVLDALTIDEGLSQNFATAILQDRRGY